MTTPRLTSAVERLLRAMPRNPDVIELGEALRAARISVSDTAPPPVSDTECQQCLTAKIKRREKTRKYRAAKGGI